MAEQNLIPCLRTGLKGRGIRTQMEFCYYKRGESFHDSGAIPTLEEKTMIRKIVLGLSTLLLLAGSPRVYVSLSPGLAEADAPKDQEGGNNIVQASSCAISICGSSF